VILAPISAIPLFFRDILRGYSFVLFVDRPGAGAAFLLATMLSPMVGVTGLLAAVTGAATARLLALPGHLMPLYVCNSLLVGLSLGIVRPLDVPLAGMVFLAATVTTWGVAVLHGWLWRLDRLPVLSAPFVGVAIIAGLAIGSDGTRLQADPDLLRLFAETFDPLDHLFVAFGSAFFTPYPLAGLVIFAALLWVSPFLAGVSTLGFALGHGLFLLWSGVGADTAARWGGFNFVLTTIALAGVFVVPSWHAFALAMTGVAAAALLAVAGLNLFFTIGIPVLALPFLLSTWLALAMLRHRTSSTSASSPEAALEQPGPPEVLWERFRLAYARGVGLASVPLAVPFFGEWRVSQGFDGPHTHQGPWRHALDFDLPEENGTTLELQGARHSSLTNFPCFGAPVLSPAYGWVATCRDDLPDNPPGEVNLRENWGNHLLIRIAPGRHVLLAHLKQGSLCVHANDAVVPGQSVATCGNSGRSITPHLHLQVQEGEALGSPTIACHLVSVAVDSGEGPCFRLAAAPDEGDRVASPSSQGQLARVLHLPSGLEMTWRWQKDGGAWQNKTLQSRLTLLGQRQIVCGQSSVTFDETPGLLALYDRAGPPDEFFDLWCLGLGLTPLAETVTRWTDAPPARLFPLPAWARQLLSLRHPLGTALDSRYRRIWDESTQRWRQTGEHRMPGNRTVLCIEASISPVGGCVWLTAVCGTHQWRAELITLNCQEDTL